MPTDLIHESAAPNAAAHALVIGVGHYPHLLGGGAQLYGEHSGMRQLSSPPLSALAFARWLTSSFNDPQRPLASVSLLAGAKEAVEFEHPVTGVKTELLRPTFANVEQAIRDWKARGDTNPEHLMLFYFCGHGIANEPDLALIMEDFGSDPDSALDYALDFRRFRLGMERCKARQQVFFIDACRAADANIIDASGYSGRPVFTPTTRRDRDLPVRQAPAFYATFAGEKAQAQTDKVSLFTEALLAALGGGGADDTNGEWWVDTSQLQKSMQFMMRRAHATGYPIAQINPVDDMSEFRIHKLAGEPTVPVCIGCRPIEDNAIATLAWQCAGKSEERGPDAGDWDTSLPLGEYEFRAQRNGADAPKIIKRNVRPPYRLVHMENG